MTASSTIQTPEVGAGLYESAAKAASGDWFGPGAPIGAMAQQAQGRSFDFQTGFNLQIRPKVYEGPTFAELRALADGYDLLRLVIETRKDQLEKLSWTIKKRGARAVKKTDAPDARTEKIRDFLAYPDREHPFGTWIRMLTEDVLVIDAPSVYVRRTKGGDLFALETIDGATIKRVLDPTGRTPLEGVAYQQILKGVPRRGLHARGAALHAAEPEDTQGLRVQSGRTGDDHGQHRPPPAAAPAELLQRREHP